MTKLLKECDAVVLVGGGPGSLGGAHLASLANTPLLPVTAFGGAAEEVFAKELRDFGYDCERMDKIVVAQKDSQLPFDINDIPTTFYEDQT